MVTYAGGPAVTDTQITAQVAQQVTFTADATFTAVRAALLGVGTARVGYSLTKPTSSGAVDWLCYGDVTHGSASLFYGDPADLSAPLVVTSGLTLWAVAVAAGSSNVGGTNTGNPPVGDVTIDPDVWLGAAFDGMISGYYIGVQAVDTGPLAPAGVLAGTLPALTGELTGDVTEPPAAGTLEASLPALTGALAGHVVQPVAGVLDGTLPALSVTLAGSADVPPGGTDLTYGSDGYGYDGAGSAATWEPALSPPPAEQRYAIRRVHESVPPPVFVDGRPEPLQPTDVLGPVWADYLRILVDGRDVTYWRGANTLLSGWQHTDPYGWAAADLFFPQVTEFDDLDDPELAWLRPGAAVRIDRVLDGAMVGADDPPFVGYLTTPEPSSEGLKAGCTGLAPTRLSARLHQPAVDFRSAADGGRRMWNAFENVGLDLLPTLGPDTGVLVPANGSRDMTRMGFTDLMLGLLIDADGSSWTVLPELASGPRCFRMAKRSMAAVDATVYAGAHGIKVSGLGRDLFDTPTSVYGEGVSTTGERWRNAVYPDLGPLVVPPYPMDDGTTFGLGTTNADTDTGDGVVVLSKELATQGLLPAGVWSLRTYDADMVDAVKEVQQGLGLNPTGVMSSGLWPKLFGVGFDTASFAGAHFAPLSQDPRTAPYLTTPDGTVVGLNPDYDPSILRVDAFVSYGEQVTKRQAKRNARAVRARGGDRVGTVVLTSDPAEMSRFDVKGGMTMRVRNLAGTGVTGLKVYVSSVQVDWGSGAVTCAVSTSAKHYLELAAIRDRDAAAKQDPAKRWRQQLRASAQVDDSMSGWEGESGAGIITPTDLVGGRWNVLPVVAARVGTIGELRLDTDPNVAFIAAMFADKVYVGTLGRTLGDPFTWRGAGEDRQTTFEQHADLLIGDDAADMTMLEAWGDPDQPCGYYPHHHTNAAGNPTTWPVSGRFRDDATWEFATTSGFLWLAVWPLADCSIDGRARIVIGGS